MRYYRAIDNMGKRVTGYVEASDVDEAFRILRERSYYPYKIGRGIPIFNNSIIQSMRRVPLKHIVVFCRQMQIVISSGIPLLQSLYSLYEDISNRRLKRIILDVYIGIQRGEGISMSFRRHEKALPAMFCDILSAGERSGNLEDSFGYMANYYEREYLMKKRLTNALIYPAFICILTIVLLQFIISYVSPYFISLYSQSGESLPRSTTFLLCLHSHLGGMRSILLPIVLSMALLIIVKISGHRFHGLIFKVPILGKYLTTIITIKICAIMSMTLGAGISLLDGLEMVRGTIRNRAVKFELEYIQSHIHRGGDILESFRSTTFSTPIFIQLLSVGLLSGNIEKAFTDISKLYETELDWETDRFLHILEPILILIIGIVVGFISYALIVPIYRLVDII